jgi:hypothetical protein
LRTNGERMMSVKVASAPIDSTFFRTSIARNAFRRQRFRKRVSFRVPKLRDT